MFDKLICIFFIVQEYYFNNPFIYLLAQLLLRDQVLDEPVATYPITDSK